MRVTAAVLNICCLTELCCLPCVEFRKSGAEHAEKLTLEALEALWPVCHWGSDDWHVNEPCMELVYCQTDRQIYLVAVKVNACPAKELRHLGLACLKVEQWIWRDGEPTGLDCASHPLRSGCFLEVGLCIFKRKARLKQTGDGFNDFVSVCGMNQQGNNCSKLSLYSLWSWNFFFACFLGFAQMFPMVSIHWESYKEWAIHQTLAIQGDI